MKEFVVALVAIVAMLTTADLGAATLGGSGGGGVLWGSTTGYLGLFQSPRSYVLGCSGPFCTSTPESDRQIVLTEDTMVSRLVVLTTSAQPGDGDLQLVVRRNGLDTVLLVLIPAGAAPGMYYNPDLHPLHEQAGDMERFDAGDRISLRVTNASTGTSAGIGGFSVKDQALVP